MKPDITKLLLSRACGSAAFLYPVYTLFLLSRDLNFTSIMCLESVLALFLVVWEVPSGVLADRLGKKHLLVLAALLEIGSTVPMFWAKGFAPFAILYALSGIGIASQSGALEAYLYGVLDDKNSMAKHLGFLRSAESAGYVVGSIVGGLMVAFGGEHAYIYCLLGMVICQCVGLVSCLALTADKPAAREQRQNFSSVLRMGSRAVFVSGSLLILLIALAMGGFSEMHYLWQPYLKERDLSVRLFGMVAVLIWCATGLGGLLAGAAVRKWSRRAILIGGGILQLGALVILVTFSNGWVSLASLLTIAFLGALFSPILAAMLNERFPDEARATALSCASWITSAVRMVVRPGIGALADRNLTYPFRIDIGLLVAGLLILIAGWRKVGRTFGRSAAAIDAIQGTDESPAEA